MLVLYTWVQIYDSPCRCCCYTVTHTWAHHGAGSKSERGSEERIEYTLTSSYSSIGIHINIRVAYIGYIRSYRTATDANVR